MRTLTLEEAISGLSRWMDLALAGEQVQIRKGNALVELRPATNAASGTSLLPPREALRQLQEEARLTSEAARRYLEEVREERVAAESRLEA